MSQRVQSPLESGRDRGEREWMEQQVMGHTQTGLESRRRRSTNKIYGVDLVPYQQPGMPRMGKLVSGSLGTVQ